MDYPAFARAIVDALDAASTSLRQSLLLDDVEQNTASRTPSATSAVERAKALHPHLGPRQAEVLGVLETAGDDGTTTGAIATEIGYDQPNVYLTLRGLTALDFVEKDSTTRPQMYRLTPLLRDEE